jgi:threonine dehydrogenase-like Zn-dependent dehydrogenase
MARDVGFEVCNNAKEDLKAKAMDYLGRNMSLAGMTADADIVIDAVGVEPVINAYISWGKLFSRIVVVGVHHGPSTIPLIDLTYGQKSIIGSGGYFPEDVKDVMAYMESGKFNIASIITHEFALKDIVKAFEVASNPNDTLKVVINFSLK